MIHLEHITKYFPTPSGRKYIFKDANLHIDRMCNVGIIGSNGAGKSTLLRLLAGIDYPNSGSVRVDGNTSWIMGLAGGIQGSMTARDNARFVCRVFGDSEREVDRKVEFIKRFSDLGGYFDMPVKTFSNGMKAKLVFSISMAFKFDIYIMDEIGAVGDKLFRRKSKAALEKRKGNSTIIKVSHNMNEMLEDCDVGVYVRDGQLIYFDDIKAAVELYQNG